MMRKRSGSVYAIDVRDPATGRIRRTAYVGKTRRAVRVRVAEHRERQPWGDAITGWRTLWRSRACSGLALWWAEVWRIVWFRPWLNYRWNRLNPSRLPKYRQAERFRDVRPGRESAATLLMSTQRVGRYRVPGEPLRPECWRPESVLPERDIPRYPDPRDRPGRWQSIATGPLRPECWSRRDDR